MKNKGCSLSGPNIKGQNRAKNFPSPKNLRNFDLLRALEIRRYEKLRFLQQKAHPCANARRLSHFASKSVARSDLQGWAGKKSESFGLHRNDVSPLTQGLRYRAACDDSYEVTYGLSIDTKIDDLNNKKAVLPQGNARCRKCSFLLKFANNIHYKYKTSHASKAATLQSSKHADA